NDKPTFAVVGEAPGAEEDRQGLPFVGPSGQLLWDELARHGLTRESAHVTNVVKCRPPDNRTPKQGETKRCLPYSQADDLNDVCSSDLNDKPTFAVVGEAPGAEEDRQGLPFVGPSGQLLWDELARHGLTRESAHVTNVVKCRPPDNRTPKQGEIKRCLPYLQA